jgi:hypothetical protein
LVRSRLQELKPLYDQFVCVRVLHMNDVNLNVFKFDYDLTWITFFLSPDEKIYSRYGGRDPKSADDRLSVEGFKYTMKLALEEHKHSKKEDPPAKPAAAKLQTWQTGQKGCLHCHQVWTKTRVEERANKKFDANSLFVYPIPENVGLTMSVDEGNKVKSVKDGSPAEMAGLKSGDLLEKIHDTKTFSQGDVMTGLHNSPWEGKITVQYRRDGNSEKAELDLPADWKKSDLKWRPSMRFERMPK